MKFLIHVDPDGFIRLRCSIGSDTRSHIDRIFDKEMENDELPSTLLSRQTFSFPFLNRSTFTRIQTRLTNVSMIRGIDRALTCPTCPTCPHRPSKIRHWPNEETKDMEKNGTEDWRLTHLFRVSRMKFSFRSLDWKGMFRQGHRHTDSFPIFSSLQIDVRWRHLHVVRRSKSNCHCIDIEEECDDNCNSNRSRDGGLTKLFFLRCIFSPLSSPDGRSSKWEEQIRLVRSIEHSNRCSPSKQKSVCSGTWEVCSTENCRSDDRISSSFFSTRKSSGDISFGISSNNVECQKGFLSVTRNSNWRTWTEKSPKWPIFFSFGAHQTREKISSRREHHRSIDLEKNQRISLIFSLNSSRKIFAEWAMWTKAKWDEPMKSLLSYVPIHFQFLRSFARRSSCFVHSKVSSVNLKCLFRHLSSSSSPRLYVFQSDHRRIAFPHSKFQMEIR